MTRALSPLGNNNQKHSMVWLNGNFNFSSNQIGQSMVAPSNLSQSADFDGCASAIFRQIPQRKAHQPHQTLMDVHLQFPGRFPNAKLTSHMLRTSIIYALAPARSRPTEQSCNQMEATKQNSVTSKRQKYNEGRTLATCTHNFT